MSSRDHPSPPDPRRGAEIAARIASAETGADALAIVQALSVSEIDDLTAWAEGQR